MNQIFIELDGTKYAIPNLDPEMNDELQRVYEYFLRRTPLDVSSFSISVKEYLDRHPTDYTAHDNYFTFMAPLWTQLMKQADYLAAESVWKFVLGPVLAWESATHLRAHKGTPYYFWAVTALTAQDLDRGFLLMHRALQEDVDSKGVKIPDSPGNAFVTLDSQYPNQYFKLHVEQIAEFLDEYLMKFRSERSRSLTLPDFRRKFLANPEVRPTALFFVYLIHKLRVFRDSVASGLAKSDFAGLLELDLLSGFCLVSDSLIKNDIQKPKAMFRELATHLLANLNSSVDGEQLGRINERFLADFGRTIACILQGTVCGLNLQPMEADIALAYGIRNRGAHNIEGHGVVTENFEEIIQRILNTLFASVEVLYT